MSTRRFEYVAGTSSKFWEVAVTVWYGRVGTDGQTQTKSLENAAATKKHAEKLIGEKTCKGYRKVQVT